MKTRNPLNTICIAAAVAVTVAIPPAANAQPAQQAQPQYVGIPRAQFNYSYSNQDDSEWCWAAAIQMVLRYYDLSVSQQEIVARSYGVGPGGELPNWPGSWQVITANLNNWNVDNNGTRYRVFAQLGWGAPPASLLLDEVGSQRPVILGYMSGPNSGHAVVATAASFYPTPVGPNIQSIVVRDPWPSPQNIANGGRVEYPGFVLAQNIESYWIIRVHRF